jgi:phthalate 4,5-dioxygenase
MTPLSQSSNNLGILKASLIIRRLVSILKICIPCNWAQIMEGQIDSAHSSSLHSSDMRPARVAGAAADSKGWYCPSTDKSPQLQCQTTSYGFHYAAIRKPIRNAARDNYYRITEYIALNSSYYVASVILPIDDTTSAFHFIAWGTDGVPPTEEWRKFTHAQKHIDLDENWRPNRTAENNCKQDRGAMKLGNFSGIHGIPNQDIAMWVIIGPIADRIRDILGASDIAIVEFRGLMAGAAQKVAAGEAAIGTGPDSVPHVDIASREGVFPKTVDWRKLGKHAG